MARRPASRNKATKKPRNAAVKRSTGKKKGKKAAPAFHPLPRTLKYCKRCPRLVEHREHIAATKRRAFADETYWGKPVPGFGDLAAPVLMVGLAPGAHGANRTGRMFTGDASGNFLYPALHRTGFGNQPESVGRDDGLRLTGIFITAPVRCVPPDNKPTRDEIETCRSWFARDVDALAGVRVVFALGRIAHDAYLDLLRDRGHKLTKASFPFAHAAEHELPDGRLMIDSYHVSAQNTNTGRLTPDMFDAVLRRARELAGLDT